jgi:hypothetical protein
MSRSGYIDDDYETQKRQWEWIRYRGQVASAIRGKRGQKFLRDLVAALDALPVRELEAGAFESSGCYCALGALAHHKGIPIPDEIREVVFDAYDADAELDANMVGDMFNITGALAREIMFENDLGCGFFFEPSDKRKVREERWQHVRQWAMARIK